MSDKIVQLNEQVIKTELKELVRQSVQEVLNGLLDSNGKLLKWSRTPVRARPRLRAN
jgi:putative transposase